MKNRLGFGIAGFVALVGVGTFLYNRQEPDLKVPEGYVRLYAGPDNTVTQGELASHYQASMALPGFRGIAIVGDGKNPSILDQGIVHPGERRNGEASRTLIFVHPSNGRIKATLDCSRIYDPVSGKYYSTSNEKN